jgi:hypothetical protein
MLGTIGLKIRLEAEIKQDGTEWVARCVPVDIWTQADTKQGGKDALHEAILGWFESCLDRSVLDAALQEAGFRRALSAVGRGIIPR